MSKGKYYKRQDYIDAAMAIIADVGVDKLTMRKVADYMRVSPMAMYKHFSNKDEFLAAVLDEFISRSDVFPDNSLPWDEWVAHMGRGMSDALCAEISWVPLLGAIRIGPTAIGVMESFVEKLTAAGFSDEQASEAFTAIIHTVVGATSIQYSLHLHQKESSAELKRLLLRSKLNDESDNHRRAIAAAMLTVLQRQQIEISLPLVIEALRSKLRKSVRSGK